MLEETVKFEILVFGFFAVATVHDPASEHQLHVQALLRILSPNGPETKRSNASSSENANLLLPASIHLRTGSSGQRG